MRIVIFDMDGTLIDSQHDITCTINHVRAQNHGLPPLPSASVVEMINRPVRNLAELFYHTPAYEIRDRELFEAHYHDQCIERPTLYPGIKSTLERLEAAGVKMAVATNATSRFARRMIEHLDIHMHFEHIVGPDIVGGVAKPEPKMLHHILKHVAFDPSHHAAWMVGDNYKDMQAAAAGGITSVLCTWGFSPQGEGDLVIDRPEQLLEIV